MVTSSAVGRFSHLRSASCSTTSLSRAAQDAQDAQDAQNVNSHSACDVDLTPLQKDWPNVRLRPDSGLKRSLRPDRPDPFQR